MGIATINPIEAHRLRQQHPGIEFIDVRTPVEYEQVHAEGARSVPLNELDPVAIQSSRHSAEEPLLVICKTGGRASRACEKLARAGASNVLNVEGGTDGWLKAGLPAVRGARATISLERQVRIGAGTLVLVGVILGWHVHEAFHLLSAVVGAGLVFAGVTDWCGMGIVLSMMPWNTRPGAGGGVGDERATCSPASGQGPAVACEGRASPRALRAEEPDQNRQ